MNVPSALLWGFVATVVMTTSIIAGQSLGWTRVDMPFIIGTMFTADRDRARVLGYLFHVVNGWLVAFVYALLFQDLHRTSWWLGAVFGFVQGSIIAVVLIPLLPGVHPRMVSDYRGPNPTRLLEPPGFLSLNYGRYTPLVLLAAHMLFGVVMGAGYRLR